MSKVYGYCRISTRKQSIARQRENIKRFEPGATIIEEEFTGTTTDRPKFNKLIKNVKADDTIIFDEVSRMSRNAEEGIELYEQLFDRGVNLIFIKEPSINTSVYREKLNKQLDKFTSTGDKATDKLLETIMTALHEYTIDIAKGQIEIAFQAAQAEVDFLHQRTSEGVRRAQAEGRQVGRAQGSKIETKKAKKAKALIIKYSKDFNGDHNDIEVMKLIELDGEISRNTYYRYKKQLLENI